MCVSPSRYKTVSTPSRSDRESPRVSSASTATNTISSSSTAQKHHCFMALKKRTGRWAEKLAVDAEPGLTTAQLMVRTSSQQFLRELPPPP